MIAARPDGVSRVFNRAIRGEYYLTPEDAQLLAEYTATLEKRLKGHNPDQGELAFDAPTPTTRTR